MNRQTKKQRTAKSVYIMGCSKQFVYSELAAKGSTSVVVSATVDKQLLRNPPLLILQCLAISL